MYPYNSTRPLSTKSLANLNEKNCTMGWGVCSVHFPLRMTQFGGFDNIIASSRASSKITSYIAIDNSYSKEILAIWKVNMALEDSMAYWKSTFSSKWKLIEISLPQGFCFRKTHRIKMNIFNYLRMEKVHSTPTNTWWKSFFFLFLDWNPLYKLIFLMLDNIIPHIIYIFIIFHDHFHRLRANEPI
jgi:hypothetical protein